MATEGSVYQRKDGRWVAQYQDAKGKTRYLYRKTKAEAKKALREALRDRDDNIVPPDKMTVGLYLDEWLDEIRGIVSYRTWINQEIAVRRHIKPHIGSLRLSEVSSREIRSLYRHKLSEGLTASTVERIHAVLNQSMREAVRSKYVRSNPVDEVKPPTRNRRVDKTILTREQVLHLLDTVCGDRFECIYVLGALCGLRIGECLCLTWDSIDFDKGTLMVNGTLWRGKVYPCKTTSSRRILKLPAIALEALKRHADSSGRCDGWLFPTSTGKPVAAHHFHKCSWRPTLRKAALPDSLTYHSLRHGAASLLLSQSVPIPVVSRYLGHANPSITMRVYAHMIDGTSGMAASGMDAALG